MGFLRRLLGGAPSTEGAGAETDATRPADAATAAASDATEADRERELLLADARRLDDDLLQRQLRYSDRSWTPPAQGGARRADDEDASDS